MQVNLIELALLLQRFMKSITVESCSRNELVAKQLDSVGGIHCKYFTSPAAPYIGCIQPGTRRKNMSSAKKHDLNESNQALSQKSTTGNSTIVRSKHQTPVSCPTNSGCNKNPASPIGLLKPYKSSSHGINQLSTGDFFHMKTRAFQASSEAASRI